MLVGMTTFEDATSWRNQTVLGRPWQDLLFAVGEVVFLISLVPLLFQDDANVPLFTGLATGFMLYAFTLAHVSYRNWITVTLSTITATIWVLVGFGISF